MSTMNPYLRYAMEKGVVFKGIEIKYDKNAPNIVTSQETINSSWEKPTSEIGFGGFTNHNKYGDDWIKINKKSPDSVSSIYIPKTLKTVDNELECFNRVIEIAETYASQHGIKLVMSLSGFTDANNFKFDSKKFYWNNKVKQIFIIMEDGMSNIVVT